VNIVSRDAWGAADPIGPLDGWPAGQPTSWTVHYEGVDVPVGEPDYADRVRSIQQYHQTHGYYDVAYNFLVDSNGVAYEGRGWDYRSAAQVSGNPVSVAICYVGGPSTPLTDAAASTINALIAQRPMEVFPHKHWFATACPGDIIVEWLDAGRPASGVVPEPSPAPPSEATETRPMVRYGATGAAVVEMQDKLRAHGNDPGISDGIYGPQTQRALLQFQAQQGLVQDGVCGPITWARLDNEPVETGSTRVLQRGDRGADVMEVQHAVRRHGYDPGPIDGIFGGRTREAVLAFQAGAGIQVDGIVGPQTRAALGI
jgi:peptidoglycan hydrolase-like protein with peptidoglycan-binding domain